MAGHHMPASAGRPAAGEQGEAAHRRYTSSGTGRHDVRTGLHGRHASSAHCGGGGDHMDTSTFQRPGPGQQHPRVPGGELEGRRDQHAADTSSYTSRASRSGASADRGESSARRGRVNESWIPPPSGRSIQLHGWPGRTALIILALGLALLAPGAGAQQCQTTGPEGFTVVCSASGAYVEISGGSSWRRCIKKICAPYPQSPGTVRTPPPIHLAPLPPFPALCACCAVCGAQACWWEVEPACHLSRALRPPILLALLRLTARTPGSSW